MSYIDTLEGPDRQRYELKIPCLYGALGESDKENSLRVLDPYQLDSESWIDDVSSWPQIELPHIYLYLIDTPGEFTREKLKAFKSLEAYNYYIK